jgi:CheY-like chemotaxis protein
VDNIPNVAYIDDSATMREVIKIAFKRENISVVAYPDAATALTEIEQSAPDVVITDVIMPDKDGYEVCQHIKQHPNLGRTPVILMSGVVNRAVAEKAFSVKADELIRKPFQPQDLIARVKHLLKPESPAASTSPPAANAAATLSSIFAAAPGVGIATRPRTTMPSPSPAASAAQAFTSGAAAAQVMPAAAPVAVMPVTTTAQAVTNTGIANTSTNSSADVARLKMEIARLEGLVKKLQSELLAEREYVKSLEEHFKTVQQQ